MRSLLVLAGCCSILLGCVETDLQVDPQPDQRTLIIEAAKAAAQDEGAVLTLVQALATHGIHLVRAQRVRAHWDPPTTGSPVAYYRLDLTVRRTMLAAADTLIFFVAAEHDSLSAVAAGVDSLGRQGPWGPWDGYTILED